MWQVWQVGEAASVCRIPRCFRSVRTPCFDEEYISHCGWSKPMWQVSQACGDFASFTENVWRVWQESQEALPKLFPSARSLAVSSIGFSPILWQPPQPFWPSMSDIGSEWIVGMAIIAAQALECLPCLYCSTCVWWHCAQVSGVGILTLAA